MPPSRRTWKEILAQRREENFVGRSEEIRIFRENFTGDEPDWWILSVTGEGGVGKSTLLNRYRDMAVKPPIGALVVLCDDRELFPVQVMGAVAEQLAQEGIVSKEFDERYRKFLELREKIESDPDAPRGVVDVVTRGLTDFTIKSLRRAPVIGLFADYIDEEAAGQTMVELTRYALAHIGNKNEVHLVKEPEKVLTPLFVGLLNQAAEQQHLIVMLDVFERTAPTLTLWLMNLFRGEYGALFEGVYFVLSGRDPLEQHWSEFMGVMAHLHLEPFTLEETRAFLGNRGITDEALVQQIHTDTGGLPVLVELLSGANPQPGQPLPDVSQDAIERFLQWTQDETHRQAALLAAIPRQFNQSVLTPLLEENTPQLFRWLCRQSYVHTDSERGWFYHEKVRALMLRYQGQVDHAQLADRHGVLADYFQAQQQRLGISEKEEYQNEAWRRLEVERVYHLVSAAPGDNWPQAVGAFVLAFHRRWRFAGRLARAILQATQETRQPGQASAAQQLLTLISAYENDEYEKVLAMLETLRQSLPDNGHTRAVYFTQRGLIYGLLGQYEQALADFDHALVLKEDMTWALIRRGEAYRLMGKYKQALANFERALEIDENNAWALANHGETYRLMGKYKQALADFGRALEIDENNAWALASRGVTYAQVGQYEQALTNFNRALEIDKNDTWALVNRGVTYRLMRKYEQALVDFDHALEIDENDAWVLAQRGVTHHLLGQYEQALVDFDRALEIDENNAWTLAQRGMTCRLLGRYKQALADFNHALEFDENYAWALAQRGETYQWLEQYEQALSDFNRSLEIDKNDAWVWAHRGETYHLLGQYKQALADFNRALELNENYAWALAQRGVTYYLLGQYEQALADFNRVLELDEGDPWMLLYRGMTCHLLGQYEESLTNWDRLLAFDENVPWALANRGNAHRLLGQYEQALADFNRALEIDENNTGALAYRAACYRALGQEDMARQDLEQALATECKSECNHYARAVALVLLERIPEALDELALAFNDRSLRIDAQHDDLLDPIRDLPEFQHLLGPNEPTEEGDT